MPPEDMYSDGPEAASPGPAPESKESTDGDAGKTGLIPKSVLGEDLKPGHVCEVEIVADHGDDYEVKYAKKGDEHEGGESESAAEPGMESAGGGMDSMLHD